MASDLTKKQFPNAPETDNFKIVSDFINGHVQKIEAYLLSTPDDQRKIDPAGIVSDIDGTLINGDNSMLLDEFLTDLYLAGLPVRLASGEGSASLHKHDTRLWAHMKTSRDISFSMINRKPEGMSPFRAPYYIGLAFDDDQRVVRMLQAFSKAGHVGTALDINSTETAKILMAWSTLKPEQKTLALQKWIDIKNNPPTYKPEPEPEGPEGGIAP